MGSRLVERTERRKSVLISLITRDAVTLGFLIDNNVKAGSIVFTDGWRGYTQI